MSTPLTVLITGAGGGLGKATATAFLAAGANVAICDINQARLDDTSKEWTEAGHDGKFLATTTNVADPASVQDLVAATVAKFGRLDVLVNNAGILDDFSGAGECSPEMWQRVINVNLHGPFNTTQAAVKQFEKQSTPGGVIINICSTAANLGYTAGAAYTASKHGLLGLSRNTAFLYADKGIYSIAMIMGAMETNVSDGMRRGEINIPAYEKVRDASSYSKDDIFVSLESVAKYIVFLSDKDIARNANGSAVDFKKNSPPN